MSSSNKPTSTVSGRMLNVNENMLNDATTQHSSMNQQEGNSRRIPQMSDASNELRSPSGTTNVTGLSSKSQRISKPSAASSIQQQNNSNHGTQEESAAASSTNQDGGIENSGDNTVVHKDRNGTITVQSTKTVGKSNYSFVSVSPTKKTLVDSQQIKHIKVIQQNEMRSWVGLQIQFTQRPGMGNIHTNRKFVKMSEYFKLEDDRFKNFLELVNRVRDIEEEKMAYSGMSQPMQEKQMAAAQNTAMTGNAGNPQRVQEFINFKMPKDLALINRDGINMLCYTKPSQYEQTQFEMFFKMVKADAKLVKGVMETSGLGQTEGNEWNVLWTSQSIKSYIYEAMNEYQKINHFPMSNELTRKDRLCENIVKMQERFGKEVFNILPDSYILPDEFADFYSHFHSLRSKEQTNMWIIKPQNSSQGKGIYIIDDISEVPIDENCIISRYVANPFLINGLKFDLRLYVCVTSMDPWRIYIYNEGLVRFASEPYDMGLGKGAKYSHLTNFSINKKNDKYVNNASAELDDCGHKWSLQALSRHLEQVGIDMNLLWSRIYDVILKSLICVDHQIQSQLKKMMHKNNCFELLGYDVLIDQDLKPWLMEVNLSPSLATESPLDLKIKSQLFVDCMNLVSVKKFDRRRDNITKMKNRFKNIMRAKSYQSRQNYPNSAAPSKHGIIGDDKNRRGRDPEDWIGDQKKSIAIEKISALNTRMREILRDTLVENTRKNNFIRIYPTRTCDIYDQYFTQPKQLHKVVYKALFTDEIIPFQTTYPILVPSRRSMTNSEHHHEDQQQNSQAGSSANMGKGGSGKPQNNSLHSNSASNGKQMRHSLKSGSIQAQQQQQQQHYDRVAAPGSPSKRHPETNSHSISLHPIIPEETPAETSSALSGRAADSSSTNNNNNNNNQDNASQVLSGGRINKANQKKNSNATTAGGEESNSGSILVVTESYGGAANASKAMVHDPNDRNNSTAKSQKRQQQMQQQQLNSDLSRRTTAKQGFIPGQQSASGAGQQTLSSQNGSKVGSINGGGLSTKSGDASTTGSQANKQSTGAGAGSNPSSLATSVEQQQPSRQHQQPNQSSSQQTQQSAVINSKDSQAYQQNTTPQSDSNGASAAVVGGNSNASSSNNNRRQVLSSTADLQSAAGSNSNSNANAATAGGREKLLITGDDVLIEYVHRLMIAVQSIKEVMLKPQWKHQIEKFIKHYVWHTSDVRRAANNKLWQRLESRLIEMKERRKRLLQNIYLRDKNMDTNLPKINPAEQTEQDYSLDFQREYETKEAQKNVIIQGFSASQLEEMLRTSTRNVAYEVISCLIDANGRGVLTEIIKFLTISNKHIIEVEENGSSILDNLNKKSHSHYGRHHNYYQNSKYGNKVPRIDESEEDCESYANINVNLAGSAQNPKKAYHGGSSSGMGISSSSANANGTNSINSGAANSSTLGSSQHHQVGSNNDIRIKIRKNSIEPHLIAKANHKQIVRQRILKEQQQRQMMQISSSSNPANGALKPIDAPIVASEDMLTSKLSSSTAVEAASGASQGSSVTPRTTSQRQASRSFNKHSNNIVAGSAGEAMIQQIQNQAALLEDSQLSIEELQIRPQKQSSEKTPNGAIHHHHQAATATNNLFDKSTTAHDLGGIVVYQGGESSQPSGTTPLEHSQHQVSKTARVGVAAETANGSGPVVSSTDVGGSGGAPAAAGFNIANRLLNRDLIATSSENLNDDLSPKSGSYYQQDGGVVSRTQNKSQYLAKHTQEASYQQQSSGSPLEGLKAVDLKIRNEPRGRLGNFKKNTGGAAIGNNSQAMAGPGVSTSQSGVGSTGGNGNNGEITNTDNRIKRKELTGKIPSTTSIHSFSKQQQQVSGSNVPSSTLTNISSNSAAAQMANNSAAGSLTQQSSLVASRPPGVDTTQTQYLQQPPLMSPKKSKRDSPAQTAAALAQSPTPMSTNSKTMGAATGQSLIGPISSTNAQPFPSDLQPVKQPMSQTEKKTEQKRSSHIAGKGQKNHVKVIKRNLIQSSELASRDLIAAVAGQNNNQGAENNHGLSESHYQGNSSNTQGPKHRQNARGSSSKGGAGTKGNGNRQHKF